MTDTKQALTNAMNKKPNGMVDFLHTGLTEFAKEANNTIDMLFGKKGPKSSMITKDLSDYENKLILISQDTMESM